MPFVLLLLRAGADPEATDYDGETAAHAAARCGQAGVVEALAQAAAGVAAAAEPPPLPAAGEPSREDDQDEREGRLPPWWFMVTDAGETATFVAAVEGHAGVLRALRAIGALEPSRPNAEGVTPMVAAALAGHSEVRACVACVLRVSSPAGAPLGGRLRCGCLRRFCAPSTNNPVLCCSEPFLFFVFLQPPRYGCGRAECLVSDSPPFSGLRYRASEEDSNLCRRFCLSLRPLLRLESRRDVGCALSK